MNLHIRLMHWHYLQLDQINNASAERELIYNSK